MTEKYQLHSEIVEPNINKFQKFLTPHVDN